MAAIPCTIEELHRRLKELKEEAKGKREELESLKKLPPAERRKRRELIRRVEKELKKIESETGKLVQQVARWRKYRKEAVRDIGTGPLSSAHLSVLTHEERVAHLQGLVDRGAAEHVILSQLYEVARLDPDRWPIATRVFAERVEKKDGTVTYRFLPRSKLIGNLEAPGTHLRGATETIRRFHRVLHEERMVYDKVLTEDSIDISDVRRLIVDQADGEVYEVRNDADAIFYSNLVMMKREAAPDLVPPFTDYAMIRGAKRARAVPLGKLGPAGRRLITNAGEPRLQEPLLIPEHVGASYVRRWLGRGKEVWNAIAREMREALKAAGVDIPENWTPRFYRLYERMKVLKEKANSRVDHYKSMLVRAMGKFGIRPKDHAQLSRVVRAMKWIDYAHEHERRRVFRENRKRGANQSEAKQAAIAHGREIYDEVLQRAIEEFGLTEGEAGFIRWVHEQFFPALYTELGLDPEEFRLGYFPRKMRTLESFYETGRGIESEGDVDWLSLDPTLNPWHASHTRWAEELRNMEDSLLLQQMQELVASEVLDLVRHGNPLDILISYARQGLTRKYVGETARDLIAEFGVEDAGLAMRFVLGDARVTVDIMERMRRDILAYMSLPTKGMARRNARIRQKLIAKARKMKKLVQELEGLHAPKPVVEAARWFLKRMGIAASRYEVRGWLDTFAWNHRYFTFGLNLMAPLRDTVSTIILMGAAHQLRHVGKAFADTYLLLLRDPAAFKKEYLRQFHRGWVRWFTEDVALEQLSIQTELQGLSLEEVARDPRHALRLLKELDWRDAATLFYKISDIGTRVMSNRASELQGREAFRRFKQHGDVDRFVLDAELATLPSETARELLRLAEEGTGEEAWIDRYVMAKQAETAMVYSRYAAAPFMDFSAGKAFFQYATWSHNFLGTLWHQLASPWRLARDGVISPATAFRAQVAMYTRWAIMAEAAYAMGAIAGVDTTDWIPWVHNASPSGGPLLSNALMLHEMIAGDADEQLKKITRDPGRRLLLIMRKVFPGFPAFPGTPAPVVRALGMLADSTGIVDDRTLRAAFGVSEEDFRDMYDGFLTVFGFHPLNRHVRPRFTPGGVLHALAGATVTPFQRGLHEAVGFPAPPQDIFRR